MSYARRAGKSRIVDPRRSDRMVDYSQHDPVIVARATLAVLENRRRWWRRQELTTGDGLTWIERAELDREYQDAVDSYDQAVRERRGI